MKFVAILSLALVLPVARADAAACTAYVCDPKDTTWPSKACGMNDPKVANQYDIRSDYCSSDEYCTYSTAASPSYCTKNPTPTATQDAYPGEPCDDMNTCFGGTCTDGKCPGMSANTTCKNVYDCGGSLTCPQIGANQYKCTAVIAAGTGGCYSNSDCVQNAGCVGANPQADPPTSGTCYEYKSIAPQQNAQGCTATSTTLVSNLYCQSGYCYLASDEKTLKCSDLVKSSKTPPMSCTIGSSCTSAPDSGSTTSLSLPCECGWDGNGYCPLFPGDELMSEYLANQRDYIGSDSLKQCNSFRNNGSIPSFDRDYCDTKTSKVSNSILYSDFKANNYASYVNADKCVVKALAHSYYEYEDAASWVVLSGLVLALIY